MFMQFRLSFIVLFMAATAAADVTVPTMFSDHAILQSNMAVPVWGTASPGEEVTVELEGHEPKTATATKNGGWMVYLDPMETSNSPRELVITGYNVIHITDVKIGEVWLAGGQSNMQRPLSNDCNAEQAMADAGNYDIRFFNVTANGGNVSNTDWQVSNATSAAEMSAVHFYFGRHLAEELEGVPIGLITSAVSATAIERWATCAGSGGLYTNQIVPMQPYGIKGVTWYQGEWDSRSGKDAEKYYRQMPCLIKEWRTDWAQVPLEFPFYMVQMPKMGISSIQIVRDAQLQTALADEKVEMIVTIDNEGQDVHPPCKELFGVRLAKLAREFEYGHSIDARSPFYNAGASYVTGNTISVVFDDVGESLYSSGDQLAEWEIAGADGKYVDADAVITANDTVQVSSPLVSEPTSARYAFSTNPAANNLVNSVGLPASPIREVAPVSTSPECGDGNCDPDEDPWSCAADCGNPPMVETDCSDGVDNDIDGSSDCDDVDCTLDLACIGCLPKGAPCTANADCCSNRCLSAGKCAK